LHIHTASASVFTGSFCWGSSWNVGSRNGAGVH
jgi:hypothetical protein